MSRRAVTSSGLLLMKGFRGLGNWNARVALLYKSTPPPPRKCLEDMFFINITSAQFVTRIPECWKNLKVVVLSAMGFPRSQNSRGNMAALNPWRQVRILTMMDSIDKVMLITAFCWYWLISHCVPQSEIDRDPTKIFLVLYNPEFNFKLNFLNF